MSKIAIHTPNGWVIIDETTGEFFGFYRKPELNQMITANTQLLNDVPQAPTNAILVAWAKLNYPMQGEYNRQRALYQAKIDQANAYLALITTAGG
jgi:hypothetical protein